ncbi:MAG: YDG domain-containing protein, partial [Candidatus Berkelbacteria bacterium]
NNGNIIIVGNQIVNSVGSAALVVGTGKYWQIWSTNASPFTGATADSTNGLVNDYVQYAATYGTTPFAVTGRGFLYTLAPTIVDTLSGAITKVYDGTTNATIPIGNYSVTTAPVNGDLVTISGQLTTGAYASPSGNVTSSNVGVSVATNPSIATATTSTASGSKPVYGYGFTFNNSLTGSITKAPLGIAVSATYAGTQTLTFGTAAKNGLTSGTINGVAGAVSITGLVGADNTSGITGVTISNANVSGNAANSTSTSGTYITAITGITASNYSLSLSAANQTLSTGTLYGVNGSLATYTAVTGTNAVWLAKATATISATKTYDGTTSLTNGQVTITGVTVGGNTQVLGYTGTATTSDANVATLSKYVVDGAMVLVAGGSGATAGVASNYALPASNSNANNSATITAATATISATKTYDGTTSLTNGQVTITGVTVG